MENLNTNIEESIDRLDYEISHDAFFEAASL